MRRSVISLAVALASAALATGSGFAGHEELTPAQATQHPVNQSGVMGRIDIVDTGAGLLVTGTAAGLAPSVGRYVSLVYDLGSVPGGPIACEPTVELLDMFVGIWAVDADGNGTLIQAVPPFAIAPLAEIDTISIRDTEVNAGFGPEAVVACGQIAVHGGR
jgi:hypothetical protein